MQAHKFEATVSENGIIKIPEIRNWVNRRVHVFIVETGSYQEKEKNNQTNFEEFSKRWEGFLKNANMENWRDNYTKYLEEKYQ